MKNLISIFVYVLVFTAVAHSQDVSESMLPQAVITAFNSEFSNAKDVEWEMRSTQFEVEFETGWGRDHEVWIESDGTIIYHKEDIRNRNLPDAVTNRIETDFTGYRIDDSARVTEGSQVYFEISLDSKRMQDMDVVIRDDGELISQKIDD
jgi:ribosomal protein L27